MRRLIWGPIAPGRRSYMRQSARLVERLIQGCRSCALAAMRRLIWSPIAPGRRSYTRQSARLLNRLIQGCWSCALAAMRRLIWDPIAPGRRSHRIHSWPSLGGGSDPTQPGQAHTSSLPSPHKQLMQLTQCSDAPHLAAGCNRRLNIGQAKHLHASGKACAHAGQAVFHYGAA